MEDNKRARRGRTTTDPALFIRVHNLAAALAPEPVAMTTAAFCSNRGRYQNQQGLSHFLSRTILPLLNLQAAAGLTPESLKASHTTHTAATNAHTHMFKRRVCVCVCVCTCE